MAGTTLHIHVNGRPVVPVADEQAPLLSVLRGELGLCGPKFGCGQGECGACVVLVDGHAQPSCDLPLWSVAGRQVVTLEGIGTPEAPHPLQTAFLDENAGQCGYCLSGVITSAAALLRRHPRPTRQQIVEALERHLCRCGAHNRMVRAIERAADHMTAQAACPQSTEKGCIAP